MFDDESGLTQDRLLMFIKANKEASKTLPMDQITFLVLEGIYRICSIMGVELDKLVHNLDANEMESIIQYRAGQDLVRAVSTMGDSMVMMMESIAYVKENNPNFGESVEKYRNTIDEKIKKQEDDLVKDFLESIPDGIDEDFI
jgi:hypothetical protein